MPAYLEPTELDSYSVPVEGADQAYYQQGVWKSTKPVAELPGATTVDRTRTVPEDYI